MQTEIKIGGLLVSRDKQQIKAALVAADRSKDWARVRITRNIIWEGTLTELDQQWSLSSEYAGCGDCDPCLGGRPDHWAISSPNIPSHQRADRAQKENE